MSAPSSVSRVKRRSISSTPSERRSCQSALPGKMVPRRRGPSNLPPLSAAIRRVPWGTAPTFRTVATFTSIIISRRVFIVIAPGHFLSSRFIVSSRRILQISALAEQDVLLDRDTGNHGGRPTVTNQRIVSTAPIVISVTPRPRRQPIDSPKKIAARVTVSGRLILSIGLTLDAGPICSAQKYASHETPVATPEAR